MKDRLAELKEKSGVKNGRSAEVNDVNDMQDGMDENDRFLQDTDWTGIDLFLSQVNDVRRRVDELKTLLIEIRDLHRKILASAGSDPSFTDTLNSTNNKFMEQSQIVSDKMHVLNEEKRNLQTDMPHYRIKTTQINGLNTIVRNIMTAHNEEQLNYRQKCHDRMNFYYKTVGEELSPEEMENAFQSGKLYNLKSLMMGDRDKEMLFRDVECRHQEILKLEANIAQLHELFQDILMLVESQGELVNNIEANVGSAKDYADNAHKNVVQAKEAKNRNIKLKIALCIGLCILIILLLIVGTSFVCFYMPFICR